MQDGIIPKIIFEDNRIIVVEKPPGILSQSDFSSRDDMLSIIKSFLKARDKKPGNVFLGLVHRLDREVGGVMVFAKNSKTARQLSEIIQAHNFTKTYIALIEDFSLSQHGELDDYISKDTKTNFSEVVSKTNQEKGKPAKLLYKAVKKIGNNTLVEIDLITGRSHQIRVQFSSRGCPLVGDKKYGAKTELQNAAGQIALWAYKLEFKHPVTGDLLTFVSRPSFLQ
jgi:23S rRNA pseudouridine1911/1915/1917 synthase